MFQYFGIVCVIAGTNIITYENLSVYQHNIASDYIHLNKLNHQVTLSRKVKPIFFSKYYTNINSNQIKTTLQNDLKHEDSVPSAY